MRTDSGIGLADPKTSGRRYLVVHVATVYPPRLGGVERVTQTMAELLAERHDAVVATTTCRSAGVPPRKRAIHCRLDVDAIGRFGLVLSAYMRFVLAPVLRRAATVVALSPEQADFLNSDLLTYSYPVALFDRTKDFVFSSGGAAIYR